MLFFFGSIYVRIKQQAEAKVVPSSSLVEVEIEVGIEVGVWVEVGVEVEVGVAI